MIEIFAPCMRVEVEPSNLGIGTRPPFPFFGKRAGKVISSLVTRPGFSFKEPRRAASAGLVRKVKIYHISGELRDLDDFGGARWRNNSIPQ